MLTLYYHHMTCALASHIALQESGLAFEAICTDPHTPEERAELQNYNPTGTVPALMADGKLITENVAIMSYVADSIDAGVLLPTDPVLRAQTLSFIAWGASSVHIAFRQMARPQNFTTDPASKDGIAAMGREVYWKYLERIDARLAGSKWIMGEQFSVADGYAFRFYTWGKLASLPVETLGNFTAFYERMLERPAVKAVLEREAAAAARAK